VMALSSRLWGRGWGDFTPKLKYTRCNIESRKLAGFYLQ
jgi:hypothetical protein